MLKRDEAADPGSCWNKARENQFVFVLIDHDDAMPETIRYWAHKRVAMGKNSYADPQIREALDAADRIEKNLPLPRTGEEPCCGT